MTSSNVIERAFLIAGSGSCLTLSDVKAALKREGFAASQIEAHFAGKLIQKQLRQTLADAAPARPEPLRAS